MPPPLSKVDPDRLRALAEGASALAGRVRADAAERAAQLELWAAEALALAEGRPRVGPDDVTRPPRPTAAWCLLVNGGVRWDGEAVLHRRLWLLLQLLLDPATPWPCPFQHLVDRLGEDLQQSTWRKRVSDLDEALRAVRWPCCYATRRACVVRD